MTNRRRKFLGYFVRDHAWLLERAAALSGYHVRVLDATSKRPGKSVELWTSDKRLNLSPYWRCYRELKAAIQQEATQ